MSYAIWGRIKDGYILWGDLKAEDYTGNDWEN
jgi:hypothetical protein